MNKYKIFVSGAAVLGLSLALQSAVCAAGGFSFEAQGRKIKIDCTIDSPQEPFANVLVLPKDFDRSSLSEENWASDKTVYKTAYTTGGSVIENVILDNDFKTGEYILYVECGSYEERSAFMVTDTKLSEAVSNINAGKSLSGVSFGADSEFFAANKDSINLLLKNAKPSSGFTAQSFADCYMQISGLVSLISSQAELDDFVDLYEPYLGTALEFIKDMTEEEKSAYVSAVREYDIGVCTPGEVISGAKFVADCKAAGDKYKLADVAKEYIKENKLSLGDYEKLNTYYEPKAMGEFKTAVKNLDSAEKIYDKFIQICEDFYDEQSDEGSSGGSGGGGGGSSSGKSSGGGVSLPVVDAAAVTAPAAGTFSDIGGHWSESYVQSCVEAGIINGYTDNTFRPDAKITRAETASLISKLFALSAADTDTFSDVKTGDWFRACVSAAYSAGIVNGYDDGSFRPGNNITRQDMAVMLMRGLENDNITIDGSISFEDDGLIADYAKESVARLAANGVITGYNNQFRPDDELTRGEAAALICRIMNIRTGGGY